MSGQETIVGVASKAYGKLYQLPKPNRHHDLLDIMYEERNRAEQVYADEEGFITSTGRYVTREEGLVIAQTAGQILSERHNHPTELYSESVW